MPPCQRSPGLYRPLWQRLLGRPAPEYGTLCRGAGDHRTGRLAATICERGALRIRTERVGRATTFGQVIRLVEQAEAAKAPVQRFADRFTAY
jgi:hypothetical protein